MTKYLRNFLIGYLVLVLGIFVGANILFAGQTFYEGDTVQVQNTLLCDTKEELTIVIESILENGWAVGFNVGKTMILSMGVNEIGEVRCTGTGLQGWTFVLVKTVGVFANVEWPDGRFHDTYIIAVLWQHKSQGIQTGFIITVWPVFSPEEDSQGIEDLKPMSAVDA